MSLLYLTAGTVWIIVWATAQKHSHKIHIVIGAVAVAGLHIAHLISHDSDMTEYSKSPDQVS